MQTNIELINVLIDNILTVSGSNKQSKDEFLQEIRKHCEAIEDKAALEFDMKEKLSTKYAHSTFN